MISVILKIFAHLYLTYGCGNIITKLVYMWTTTPSPIYHHSYTHFCHLSYFLNLPTCGCTVGNVQLRYLYIGLTSHRVRRFLIKKVTKPKSIGNIILIIFHYKVKSFKSSLITLSRMSASMLALAGGILFFSSPSVLERLVYTKDFRYPHKK